MGIVYSCFSVCTGCLDMLAARVGMVRALARADSHGVYNRLEGDTFLTKVLPRQTLTSEALRSLRTVKNARDLAEACSTIAPGRIIRSACPTGACEGDVRTLRERLGVKHLVDLRSDVERRHDGDDLLLIKDAEVRVFGPKTGKVETYVRGTNGAQEATMTVHHVSLLERAKYQRALLRRVSMSTAAYVIFWNFIDQSRAKAAALQEINKAGLPGLYECILETSGPEMKHIMETVTEAVESGSPTLFFCRMGKDRTGLVAALILASCGASASEIISDYARSEDNHGVALGGMESDKEMSGLDTEQFSAAPPEVMQATLEYVEDRYGGFRGYLDSIGFGPEAQRRLASCLADVPKRATL